MNVQTFLLPGSYANPIRDTRPLLGKSEAPEVVHERNDSFSLTADLSRQPLGMINPDINGDGRVTREEWEEAESRPNVMNDQARTWFPSHTESLDWILHHPPRREKPLICKDEDHKFTPPANYRPVLTWTDEPSPLGPWMEPVPILTHPK